MPHGAELITTIAASLGLAMIMGFVAARMKMPPMAGYLLAGILAKRHRGALGYRLMAGGTV